MSLQRTWGTALSSVLLALAGCGGSNDGRTPITAITVFGDSQSDVGTFQVATGNASNPAKFTVNPGNIWVDNVAAAYGLKLSPNRSLTLDKKASGVATAGTGTATVLGGNGYAEGGARIAQLPSESGIGNNQVVAPVAQQVSNYLGTHTGFAANELVIIGGGSNDTYAQFNAICWGGDDNGVGVGNTTMASASTHIAKAANDLLAQVARVRSNGAKTVLVYGAGDWSVTPFGNRFLAASYQATGCTAPVTAAQASGWATQFNSIVSQGVAGMAGVVYLDFPSTLAPASANPSQYGLVNVTSPACNNTTPTNSAAFCNTATLVAPNADQTYLYADSLHRTPRGHRILSDAALGLLTGIARAAN